MIKVSNKLLDTVIKATAPALNKIVKIILQIFVTLFSIVQTGVEFPRHAKIQNFLSGYAYQVSDSLIGGNRCDAFQQTELSMDRATFQNALRRG